MVPDLQRPWPPQLEEGSGRREESQQGKEEEATTRVGCKYCQLRFKGYDQLEQTAYHES